MGNFKRVGLMFDCSRNAVFSLGALKQLIDLMAKMGYNTLLLYMEDTFEVDDNPYFGYARGRYSQSELREIDDYAASKGLEVIPCIQTLAHHHALSILPAYRGYFDCNDILLIDEEKVYDLIDKMFASLRKCFRTNMINIGMDEAHMVGRGRYYTLHGETNKTDLFVRHIRRVSEIGKKYGYSMTMWSDMFFRIAFKGKYYDDKLEVPDEIKALIPDNVDLVYWDYYSQDEAHYDGMIEAHNKLKKNSWFAGGFWSWDSFTPCNLYSLETSKAALASCEKNGVENIFFTLWGDDSAECSRFSLLPCIFSASERVKGNNDEESIKAKFKEMFGVSFDDFLLLDLSKQSEKSTNPEKYMFYNDLFNGLMDSLILDEAKESYASFSEKMESLTTHSEWGYLFRTHKALADVLVLKADLGKRIRHAYQSSDKEALRTLIAECDDLKEKLCIFYDCFEKQWMKENKPHGFDVQDIRLGGIIARTEHCKKRIEAYVAGEIEKIEELEGEPLDYLGRGTEYVKEEIRLKPFRKIYTTNRLSH